MTIIRSCDEKFGVWREAEASDGHSMAIKGVPGFTSGHIKNVDDAVNSPTCNVFAIWTLDIENQTEVKSEFHSE